MFVARHSCPKGHAMYTKARYVVIAAVLAIGLPLAAQGTKPAMPEIKGPVMFNTKEADAILAALQVFPANNAWNEDISARPLLKNSKEMVATVGVAGKLAVNYDMGFIIVPPGQKKVEV